MKYKNVFNLNGKGQIIACPQRFTLAISFAALLLALTACLQVSANESVEVAPPPVEVAAPTAMISHEEVHDSAYLAENPELLKTHPPASAEDGSESELLAANPELAMAGRHADVVEKRAEAAYLAENPELLKAQPPVIVEKMPESTFLAANPELMVARRYAAVVEWNRQHFPGR